jgi:nickel-dependent lactate racemase
MTLVGRDRFNCEVFLNSAVLRAGQVIAIGSVEPHYFAGYTGGRKSIFPGLTDLATVERNHNLANSLEAAPLKLAENPMAEHLDELMGLIDQDKLFGIQIVTDARHQVAGVFCGSLAKGFRDAVGLAQDIFAHSVTHKYDVVLCELLPPLDKNLYQVQKALENCQAAVADGGSAVVVAACEEGIGSDYFFDLAAKWDRDLNIPRDGKPTFGSHKLSRVNSIGKRIGVRLYSRLSDELPRRVFYEPLHDIERFLKERAEKRTLLRMAVVHDAGHTVLTVN